MLLAYVCDTVQAKNPIVFRILTRKTSILVWICMAIKPMRGGKQKHGQILLINDDLTPYFMLFKKRFESITKFHP